MRNLAAAPPDRQTCANATVDEIDTDSRHYACIGRGREERRRDDIFIGWQSARAASLAEARTDERDMALLASHDLCRCCEGGKYGDGR